MKQKRERVFRRYRGVAIHRNKEIVAGSDFDYTPEGGLVLRKPQWVITYAYVDGYPESSVQEVKDSIDECIVEAEKRGIPADMMVETLNAYRS